VLRARKRSTKGVGPLILGVDPAALGGDRFSIAARRGMEVEWVQFRTKIDAQEGTAWVRSLIDKHKPNRVNVDAGGIGHAIVSGLRHMGPAYALLVRAVNFGGTSEHRQAFAKHLPGPWNRRAEMWSRLKEWLEDELGAKLPDIDALQSDICAARLKPRLDGNFLLESKEELRKRGVRSPDLADSVALTFAFMEYFQEFSTPKAPEKFAEVDNSRNVTTFGELSGPTSWMA
jgi:hypothetical protein